MEHLFPTWSLEDWSSPPPPQWTWSKPCSVFGVERGFAPVTNRDLYCSICYLSGSFYEHLIVTYGTLSIQQNPRKLIGNNAVTTALWLTKYAKSMNECGIKFFRAEPQTHMYFYLSSCHYRLYFRPQHTYIHVCTSFPCCNWQKAIGCPLPLLERHETKSRTFPPPPNQFCLADLSPTLACVLFFYFP